MSLSRRELFRRAALPAAMAVAALASPAGEVDKTSLWRVGGGYAGFGFDGLRSIDADAWGTLSSDAISDVEPRLQFWIRQWGRPQMITYFREFVRLKYPRDLRVEITYRSPQQTMVGYVT